MAEPHLLTVRAVPDTDDLDWSVGTCPDIRHGAPCAVWMTCTRKVCLGRKSPYEISVGRNAGESEVVLHGRVHQWIDGSWMVPVNACAAQTEDVSEYVWEIHATKGDGTWPVEVDYHGDGDWGLCLIEERESADA